MPTVILLDVSLSMTKPIEIIDRSESTPKQLAIIGINAFLDHMSANTRLEFISLMCFSSLYEEKCAFTRDYNSIKATLQNIDDYDKTCIETALHGVNQMILGEWGNNMACQIVLVTDGSVGVGPMSLKGSLATLNQRTPKNPFPVPFNFPAKLHIVCITPPNDHCYQKSKPLYQKLIDLSGYEGSISIPDQLSEAGVAALFQKLAENIYTSFNGTLKCGNLKSKIMLYPAPVHHTKVTDFDCQTYSVSETIEVLGFIPVSDIGSPMAVSRHLILHSINGKDPMAMETDIDLTIDDDVIDEGKTPSFCVLLHGALKVENMAALVSLADNWFGFIYSWADTKKKSNLMLTLLVPGPDSVPWLGNLNNLGCVEQFENCGSFPIRPPEKRSYSQNGVVWIRPSGLQSDIQKILRHARKLPEKTQQFYKELNRLRKAAISLGFLELLLALATIFEQECLSLPGNVHPDCAVQLHHAANVLKKTQSQDAKYVITPYVANYNNFFYEEGKSDKIFTLLKNPDTNLLLMPKFINELDSLGLKIDDPRLGQMFSQIEDYKKTHGETYYRGISQETFKELTKSNIQLITRAFENELVVSNWNDFQKEIEEIFKLCDSNEKGEVATYIPQLGQVDPSNWAVSICTVDGQRFSMGKFKEYFTIQSVSKPFTYATALDNLGEEVVHRYVGKEPSGRMFNELVLNHDRKPHNPMINPGAIVVCSIIHSMIDQFGGKPSLVFDNTKQYFDKLAGGLHIGFNTSVYISEQEAADRNYAIAFYLKENKCFPPTSRLGDTLKFYFRCCSLDVNTRILALMGATLANAGVNPITSDRVFKAASVKNTLSLMYSCGMYDYSGEFAFEVGLPGKSGVSGAMVIAIPDVMGIGLWSPRLGRLGNSMRGIQFCRELVKRFPYHQYDNQRVYPDHADRRKVISESDKKNMTTFGILSAAAGGHVHILKKFFLYGINLENADYDGRTALHLAAVEGHLECVEFLVGSAQVKIDPVDRWNQTPLMVAEKSNQTSVVKFLKSYKTTDKSDDTKSREFRNVKIEPNNSTLEEPDFNPLDKESSHDDDPIDPKKKDGS